LPHCCSSQRLLGHCDSTLQQVPPQTLSRSRLLEATFRSPAATAVRPPLRGRRSRPASSTAVSHLPLTRSALSSRPALRQFVQRSKPAPGRPGCGAASGLSVVCEPSALRCSAPIFVEYWLPPAGCAVRAAATATRISRCGSPQELRSRSTRRSTAERNGSCRRLPTLCALRLREQNRTS
jgi:hypothetical protein